MKFRCSRHETDRKSLEILIALYQYVINIWVVIVRWGVPMPKMGRNLAKLRY